MSPPATLIALGALCITLGGVWLHWSRLLWPRVDEDEFTAPQPRFAWATKSWEGRDLVSPLFFSPRAAGRWCAESDLSPEHFTLVRLEGGVPQPASMELTAKAHAEAFTRRVIA